IAEFRPHIVFEYNAEYSSRGKGDPHAICEFFRMHRYRLFAVGRTWAEAVGPGNWPDCANIWAAPLGLHQEKSFDEEHWEGSPLKLDRIRSGGFTFPMKLRPSVI